MSHSCEAFHRLQPRGARRPLTGQLIPGTHYLKAQRVRSLIRQEMAARSGASTRW